MVDSEAFAFLAGKKSVLVLAQKSLPVVEIFESSFDTVLYESLCPEVLDTLLPTVTSQKIDIIIAQPHEGLFQRLDHIRSVYAKLLIIGCIGQDGCEKEVIDISDKVVTEDIDPERFMRKVFPALRDSYATMHYEITEAATADEQELEVIYLCQSMDTVSQAFDSGDLSQELFTRLHEDLQRVQKLFSEYMIRSKRIQPVIRELTDFTATLQTGELEIASIEGFEYLSRIVEDVSIFLKKHFLLREFEDIHLIEDSLENSVLAMKRKFKNGDDADDGSEMEFF